MLFAFARTVSPPPAAQSAPLVSPAWWYMGTLCGLIPSQGKLLRRATSRDPAVRGVGWKSSFRYVDQLHRLPLYVHDLERAGATKFMMGSCDNNRPSQQFEVLSCAVMLEEKKKTGPTPYDMLTIGDRRSTDPAWVTQVQQAYLSR
ncbi:hypothetical protein PF010_g29064 [Phytophthora fragariae]|uniref:Uncharacterized protein n=1 Tax=Phytophthora fragariae TaxID=53985 RepID=A0A6A4B1R3_9STRA|nr:hypothetical protein PF003_g19941 [Phytophthora fragariae]KAE8919087.1 hypothetical protein PF009_g30599 [Phytophthora fragariae]KAE9063271.1 hypothetical protein PF010_g29064 [Phytophthora fragariae]KAE9267479.1 hypothetical protein PF001_g30058 [Phytophthora fragariae]